MVREQVSGFPKSLYLAAHLSWLLKHHSKQFTFRWSILPPTPMRQTSPWQQRPNPSFCIWPGVEPGTQEVPLDGCTYGMSGWINDYYTVAEMPTRSVCALRLDAGIERLVLSQIPDHMRNWQHLCGTGGRDAADLGGFWKVVMCGLASARKACQQNPLSAV